MDWAGKEKKREMLLIGFSAIIESSGFSCPVTVNGLYHRDARQPGRAGRDCTW